MVDARGDVLPVAPARCSRAQAYAAEGRQVRAVVAAVYVRAVASSRARGAPGAARTPLIPQLIDTFADELEDRVIQFGRVGVRLDVAPDTALEVRRYIQILIAKQRDYPIMLFITPPEGARARRGKRAKAPRARRPFHLPKRLPKPTPGKQAARMSHRPTSPTPRSLRRQAPPPRPRDCRPSPHR